MTEIILKTSKLEKAAAMIEDAIAAKIIQLEVSKQRYCKNLEIFEKKHNITSKM